MASATRDERTKALNDFLVKAKDGREKKVSSETDSKSHRSPPKHTQKRDNGLMIHHLKQYEDIMKQQPSRHTETQNAREREQVITSAKQRYENKMSDHDKTKEKPPGKSNVWDKRSRLLQDLTPASDREEQEMLEKALQLSIQDSRNDFDEDFSHLLDQPSSNNGNGGAHYMSPQRHPQPPQRSISENNSIAQSPKRHQNAFNAKSNSYDGRRTSNSGNHLDDIDDDFPSLVSGSKSGTRVGTDEFPSLVPASKSGSKQGVNGFPSLVPESKGGADALWDSTGTGSLGAEEEAEEQEVSMRFDEDPDGMAMGDYPDRFSNDDKRKSPVNQASYYNGGARPKTNYRQHQPYQHHNGIFESNSPAYNGTFQSKPPSYKAYNGQSNWSKNLPPRFAKKQRSPTHRDQVEMRPFEARYNQTKQNGHSDRERMEQGPPHKTVVEFVPASSSFPKVHESSKDNSCENGDAIHHDDPSVVPPVKQSDPIMKDITLKNTDIAIDKVPSTDQVPSTDPVHNDDLNSLVQGYHQNKKKESSISPIQLLDELFKPNGDIYDSSDDSASANEEDISKDVQRKTKGKTIKQTTKHDKQVTAIELKPQPNDTEMAQNSQHQFTPIMTDSTYGPPVDQEPLVFQQLSSDSDTGITQEMAPQTQIYTPNMVDPALPSTVGFQEHLSPPVTQVVSLSVSPNQVKPVDEFVQPFIMTPPAQYSIVGIDLQFLDSTDDSVGSSPFREEDIIQHIELKAPAPLDSGAKAAEVDKNRDFDDFQELCKMHGIVTQDPTETKSQDVNKEPNDTEVEAKDAELNDTMMRQNDPNIAHSDENGSSQTEQPEVVKKSETPRKYVSVSIKKLKENSPDAIRYDSETDSEIVELNKGPNVNQEAGFDGKVTAQGHGISANGSGTRKMLDLHNEPHLHIGPHLHNAPHLHNGPHLHMTSSSGADHEERESSTMSVDNESAGDTGRGTFSDSVSNCSSVDKEYNPEIPAYAFRAYPMPPMHPQMPPHPFAMMPHGGYPPFSHPGMHPHAMYPMMPPVFPPFFQQPPVPLNAQHMGPTNEHSTNSQTPKDSPQTPTIEQQSQPSTVQQSPPPNADHGTPNNQAMPLPEAQRPTSSNDIQGSSPRASPKRVNMPVETHNESSDESRTPSLSAEESPKPAPFPAMPFPQMMMPFPPQAMMSFPPNMGVQAGEVMVPTMQQGGLRGAPVGQPSQKADTTVPNNNGTQLNTNDVVPDAENQVPNANGSVPNETGTVPNGMVPDPNGMVPDGQLPPMMVPTPHGMPPAPYPSSQHPGMIRGPSPMMHPQMYRMAMYQYHQWMMYMQRMGFMPPPMPHSSGMVGGHPVPPPFCPPQMYPGYSGGGGGPNQAGNTANMAPNEEASAAGNNGNIGPTTAGNNGNTSQAQETVAEEPPKVKSKTDSTTFQMNTSTSAPSSARNITPKHSPGRPVLSMDVASLHSDEINTGPQLSSKEGKIKPCSKGIHCEVMDKCDEYHPAWQKSRIFHKRGRCKSENE